MSELTEDGRRRCTGKHLHPVEKFVVMTTLAGLVILSLASALLAAYGVTYAVVVAATVALSTPAFTAFFLPLLIASGIFLTGVYLLTNTDLGRRLLRA